MFLSPDVVVAMRAVMLVVVAIGDVDDQGPDDVGLAEEHTAEDAAVPPIVATAATMHVEGDMHAITVATAELADPSVTLVVAVVPTVVRRVRHASRRSAMHVSPSVRHASPTSARARVRARSRRSPSPRRRSVVHVR